MCFVIICLAVIFNKAFVDSADTFDDVSTGGEYCQFENFNPKCPANSVVLVTKALFGRMRLGRCITEKEIRGFGNLIHDQKYLGCHVDVQDLINDWCSMRSECLVKVPDTRLTDLEPCLQGLIMHLEAEHICVPVYNTEGSSCSLPVFHNGKYLLSESLKTRKCGTLQDPWILEAMKGQKVVVKYVNFGDKKDSSSCDDASVVFQDGNGNINSTLCKNNWYKEEGVQRELSPFKSLSNVVKMFVTDLNLPKNKFALQIEAEGCLDIIPPEDTWLRRTNDDIVLGCYSSKQTWYLRCENNQWNGVIGNCSHLDQTPFEKKIDEGLKREKMIMSKSHQVLAIVAIFGMGVVICSAIVCIGAVCARRYKLATKVKGFDTKGQSLMLPENAYNQHTYSSNYEFKAGGYNNGTIMDGKNNLVPNGSTDKEQTYFVLEDDQTMAIK